MIDCFSLSGLVKFSINQLEFFIGKILFLLNNVIPSSQFGTIEILRSCKMYKFVLFETIQLRILWKLNKICWNVLDFLLFQTASSWKRSFLSYLLSWIFHVPTTKIRSITIGVLQTSVAKLQFVRNLIRRQQTNEAEWLINN